MATLHQTNIHSWETYPHPDRSWPTPNCLDQVQRTRAEIYPGPCSILVVGCGGENSEAFEYADELDENCHIIGIDVNQRMIESAKAKAMTNMSYSRVAFLVASITDQETLEKILPESIDVATLVGVEGNIIHDKDLMFAYMVLGDLLRQGGLLIISDHAMNLDLDGYWKRRYDTSLAALIRAGILEQDPSGRELCDHEMWGTLVIRPSGKGAIGRDAVTTMAVDELVHCLHANPPQYERLARHRIAPPLDLLTQAGFEVEETRLELVALEDAEFAEGNPWSRLTNYQIVARKVLGGWDRPFLAPFRPKTM